MVLQQGCFAAAVGAADHDARAGGDSAPQAPQQRGACIIPDAQILQGDHKTAEMGRAREIEAHIAAALGLLHALFIIQVALQFARPRLGLPGHAFGHGALVILVALEGHHRPRRG